MTDSTFEAFRKAEALLADRRPLEALRQLRPVLEEAPDAPSVQLLAGRAYLGSAQLRMAVAMNPSPEYQEALGEVKARIAVER